MPRVRLRAIVVVSACLLWAAVLTGRQTIISTDGGSLARDANAPPKGTGVVMGRTVDAASGKPINDVVVTLGMTVPPFGSYPAVVSDDQGRFVVRDLPKSAFRFYAVKPGYIPGGYSKRPIFTEDNYYGQSMNLNDAERALDVTITLWKYAAIEGTVTDENGDPIVGTSVRALPRRVLAGRAQFSFEINVTPFGLYSARTDDRGVYRLDSLPPGDYVVAVPVIVWSAPKSRGVTASTSPADATSSSSSGLMSWTGGGRGGGTGTGSINVGDENFGFVSFPGLSSTTTPPMLAGFTPQGRPLVYETQYYSSSTSLSRATVVTVGSGDSKPGVDFRLRPVPASKISGVVSGPNGPAKSLTLRLVSAEMSSTSADPEIAITTTDGDGRFVFLGVTPGQYSIRALDVPRPRPAASTSSAVQTSGGTGGTIFFSSGSDAAIPDDPVWWTDTPVALGERDVNDVAVVLRPGARISGRVEFDGDAVRPPSRNVRVTINRADGQRANNYSLTSGRVDDQWKLTTYGQVPGQYLVQATGSTPGWYFAGAFVGARDVSILPLDVGASDIDDVVIKLTDKPLGTIAGTITDSKAQPDLRATALVFPADRALWTNHGVSPRMLRAAGAGRNARYSAENLPAGDYLVVAVDDLPPGWADPKMLDGFARNATRVTLRDHETATRDLRALPGGTVPTTAARLTLSDRDNDLTPARRAHGPFVDESDEQQSRDLTAPAAQSGTARISGIASLDDRGQQPAARVTVNLSGPAAFGSRAIITTDNGRFDFSGLPAGRYTLIASKPAFLNTTYGASRIGGPGTPIVLTDGQQLGNLTLTIRKGSVITGLVRDERGQPMQGASVQLLVYQTAGGERHLVNSREQTRTDDRGMYRIFGLAPGDYYVAASANYVTGSARPTTAADVQFAQQTTTSMTAGPGVGANGPANPAASAPPSRRYVPVLYPGVFTSDGAQVVKLGVGEERSGIDLMLRMVPAITIEGSVVGGGTLPSNLEVRLISVSDVIPTTGIGDISNLIPVRVGPNGRFSYSNITPGRYVVAAMTQSARGRAASDATTGPGLWGMTPVDVNGVDVSNVLVTLQPGMTVAGRVRFDGMTLEAPKDLSTVRVLLTPVLTGGQVAMGQTSASASADGSFTFVGLTPGQYRLTASSTNETRAGWLIKAISAAKQDATDGPFELKSGENITDASIVFGDRPAELSGTLQDASGRAATDYFVVLLPADPATWGSANRRVQQARPSTDGKFTFRTLLPGDYILAAATDVDLATITDRSFLTELARSGTKITIAEGEKKAQDIRIGK